MSSNPYEPMRPIRRSERPPITLNAEPSPDDWTREPPTEAHYDAGRAWIIDDVPFPQICDRLCREGLSPTQAASVTAVLARQWVQPLVLGGLSWEDLSSRLTVRGLNEEEATGILTAAGKKFGTGVEVRKGNRDRGYIVGTIILMLGTAVWFGNKTGLFPTFPFAGIILIFIGGAIATAWYRHR